MSKKLFFIILLFILVLPVAIFLIYKNYFRQSEVRSKAVVSEKKPELNLLDLEKRPFLNLRAINGGKEVEITIDKLKNKEKKVEYILEYQSGNLLQSAKGSLELTKEPISTKILLGSCSAGGKCTYDKNVSKGSLYLYFFNSKNYGLKANFTFNKVSEKDGIFTSYDGKITLKTDKDSLDKNDYLIVCETMGLPKELKKEIIAGPIGFFNQQGREIKGQLTFKLFEKDLSASKIYGWDGEKWQEYKSKTEGDTISAAIDRLSVFVLAK